MPTKVYAGGSGTVKFPGYGRGKKRSLSDEKRERNKQATKKARRSASKSSHKPW